MSSLRRCHASKLCVMHRLLCVQQLVGALARDCGRACAAVVGGDNGGLFFRSRHEQLACPVLPAGCPYIQSLC